MIPDVLLIGLGPTTASALQSLISSCRVVGVVRATNQADDGIAELAAGEGVPIFTDTSVSAVDDLVTRLAPDCVVVSSYDRILPPWLLARCPFINVHYSPLPRYRGRANVNWAILNGESDTAISIHVLDRELDAGRLLFQAVVPIGPHDTVADLYDLLNDIQRRELGAAVLRHLAGYEGQPQHGEPSYGCTRLPRDGEIDWQQSTDTIYALVRALVAPFPGAFTYLDGRRLVVWEAVPVEEVSYAGRVPGRVVGVSRARGHVDVLTGDGVLRLLTVQLEGDKPCAPASLVRSVKVTLGLSTAELLGRIQALETMVARLASLVEESAGGTNRISQGEPIASIERLQRP